MLHIPVRPVVAVITAALLTGAMVATSDYRAAAADEAVDWKVPVTVTSTINVGDSVTWTWSDALPHTVSSVSGPVAFGSETLTGAGSTYSFTFTQAGTYTYRCNIHPNGMTGTVVVQATGPTPSATPTTPTSTATPPTPAPTVTSPAGARTVTLSGAEEVPPVTTTATGTFEWALNGSALSYRLRANGAGIRAAHLHLAAKGSNGPVVVSLFGSSDGVSSFDVGGTVAVSDLSGPVAGNLADFLAALRAGNLYVNVHSADHPAGVLRGQLPAQPAAPATGSGLVSPDSSGNGLLAQVALALGGTLVLGGAAVAFGRRGRRAGRG